MQEIRRTEGDRERRCFHVEFAGFVSDSGSQGLLRRTRLPLRLPGLDHLCAEAFLENFEDLRTPGFVERPHQHESHILGNVIPAIESFELRDGGGLERLREADHGTAVRMLCERRRENILEEAPAGRVLVFAQLFENHFALTHEVFFKETLRSRHPAEAVDDFLPLMRSTGDVINGLIEGRVGVDITAQRFDIEGHAAGRSAPRFLGRRILEQHVFEKMGKSCLVRSFVSATDAIPPVSGRDGTLTLQEDHGNTVRKLDFFKFAHHMHQGNCYCRSCHFLCSVFRAGSPARSRAGSFAALRRGLFRTAQHRFSGQPHRLWADCPSGAAATDSSPVQD